MTRKLTLLLAVFVLAGGALAAGCGGGDDNGGSKKSSSSTSTSTSGGGGATTDSAAAKSAKEGCDAAIKGNAAIQASKRDALSKECQKVADAAGTGDKDKYKAEYSKFCNQLADALPSAARASAKQACQQSVDAIQ